MYVYSADSMSGMFTLLSIAGAVALLLWAVRMVRTGIDRAYGAELRRFLRRAASSRPGAVAAGTVLAVGLQGSTAVALLITGAVASGLTTAPIALAVLLGADLGSALVVWVLSLDLSLLVPALLLAGVATFLGSQRERVRQAARMVIGVGLILLSLRLLGEASEPLRSSDFLRVVTIYLADDLLTAFVVAALLTWVMHSGVAAVLLLASFAGHGIVQGQLSLALVLGINLGSGIVAAVLTRSHERSAWIVPLSNLVVRSLLAVACLLVLGLIDVSGLLAGFSAANGVVTVHIVFNVAVVVIGTPLARSVVSAVGSLLPAGPAAEPGSDQADPERKTSLDPDMVGQPRQAIANAIREILRMSDIVSRMLDDVIGVLADGDKPRIAQIAQLDDEVDSRYTRIKLYLARIGHDDMSESETRRLSELMTFCIKLEQAADIVVKNMLPLADKRRSRDVKFSRQGWLELSDLHERVSANLQLALNVLVTADVESARALIEEKQNVRQLEQASTARHMDRLRKGTVKSVETSEIHLDAIRDLVQINTLLTAIAYPILERSGELLDSRLISASS
ncbi:MAG: Na/Pi cotransporter family protein [Proteobacteria bacterium]|nr:Na/Pi cotransporter family protein [Pseudomonadota bacterium]